MKQQCPVCGNDIAYIKTDMCDACGCVRPGSVAAQWLGKNAPRLICRNPDCGTPDYPTVIFPQQLPGGGTPLLDQGVLNIPDRCYIRGCKKPHPTEAELSTWQSLGDFVSFWLAPLALFPTGLMLSLSPGGEDWLFRLCVSVVFAASFSAFSKAVIHRFSIVRKGRAIINILPVKGDHSYPLKATALFLGCLFVPWLQLGIYPIVAYLLLLSLLNRYLPWLCYQFPLSPFNCYDEELPDWAKNPMHSLLDRAIKFSHDWLNWSGALIVLVAVVAYSITISIRGSLFLSASSPTGTGNFWNDFCAELAYNNALFGGVLMWLVITGALLSVVVGICYPFVKSRSQTA